MKFKVIVAIIFLLFIFKSQAIQRISENTNTLKIETINNDSLIQTSSSTSISNQTLVSSKINLNINPINDSISHHGSPTDTIIQKVDTLLLLGNPFFIDLVYNGIPIRLDVNSQSTLKNLIYGQNESPILLNKKNQSPDEIITQLRDSARNQITRKAANLYIMTFDELPDPNVNKNRFLGKKNTSNVQLIKVDNFQNYQDKLVIKNPKISPWQYKLNSLAQFSESVISTNWYQGGNSNLAVLGILSGQLSYDDKKCIQWDNTAEWRMGFNSVAGDTIHWLSTNDDILKINSKLGIKATGNFFYSSSVDFSTQFFNSYKGINSYELKAAFLAPVRLNIGVGMDYKYEKIFSLMVSPFSYKYIYVNSVVESATSKQIDPNLFGIKTGQNVLSEIGSSIKATYSAPITNDIQLDSRFSCYTNYQKVEIDWEIVANMSINRYFSTRISLNPRYDNTVIEKNGSVAKLQFKQFLSIGFSHKLM